MTAPTRTLGFADLFFYAASVALSIRWISVSAAAGPASLPVWVLAVVVFSVPLVLATAELTGRFPGEGGVYTWTGETFGPFWGFLCGWLYWVSNLPFFSGVLVFMLNLGALALGPAGKPILDQPWLFTSVAVMLSLLVGVAHYFGLGTGKWLSNVGGVSNFVLIALLAATAFGVGLRHGSATDFVHADYRPPLGAAGAILWATMIFGVAGQESLAFLRNDVRGGMRTILGVLATVSLVQIAFYLLGTSSLLIILSPQTATRLSGLPDALILGLKTLGLGPVAPLVLIGGFLCSLGSYSAWFGVGARLPFAAGIDAYLPAAFGRRDPRTGAPVVSIAVQTVIVAVIVVISQAGDTLKGAYDFLVSMTVLSYTLPFIFLFAVFLAVQGRAAPADAWRLPGGALLGRLVGVVGLAATLAAVGCTLVPSPDARDQTGEMLKLLLASGVLIFSGVAFYAAARWRSLVRARMTP
ncbi:MAG TPA: APC family permease [Caulobacteraceae bacterium]|nr:APC family permease [Caulobacteraceae bacterium]